MAGRKKPGNALPTRTTQTQGAMRAAALLRQEIDEATAKHEETLRRTKDPTRPPLLDEIDPHERYGKGTGERYSATPDSTRHLAAVSERTGARLRQRLKEATENGLELRLDARQASRVADLLDRFVPHLHRRLTYLEQMQAAARVVAKHGTGNPATKLRRALAFILEREPDGTRGPIFDPIEVIRDYRLLTRSERVVTLWNEIERAFDLPGREIACPLTPSAAIEILAVHHGFASPTACLRYLVRKKKDAEAKDAENADLAELVFSTDPTPSPSWIVETLRNLPQER